MYFMHAFTRRRRVLAVRGRAGHALALIAVSGLLGLLGAVASASGPAAADSVSGLSGAVASVPAPVVAAPFDPFITSGSPTAAVGQSVLLGANPGVSISLTPFSIVISDLTTNTVTTTCGEVTNCEVWVTENEATTQEYVAYVVGTSGEILATSNTFFQTWTNSGWRISLTTTGAGGGLEEVTATANFQLGDTIYFIEIFDETTGQLLNPEFGCGIQASCTVTFQPTDDANGDTVVAFVTTATATYPPPLSGIQASSVAL
jgi:hypothetical protein